MVGVHEFWANPGNETFVFRASYGSDSIDDFKGGAGARDVIEVDIDLAVDCTALQSYMNDWNGSTTFIDLEVAMSSRSKAPRLLTSMPATSGSPRSFEYGLVVPDA